MHLLRNRRPTGPLRKITIQVQSEPDLLARMEQLNGALLRVLAGSHARVIDVLRSDIENGCVELLIEATGHVPIVTGTVTVDVEPWDGDLPRTPADADI